eukprot:gene4177-14277_t
MMISKQQTVSRLSGTQQRAVAPRPARFARGVAARAAEEEKEAPPPAGPPSGSGRNIAGASALFAAPTPAAPPPPPPPAGPPSGSGRNIAGASALFAVTDFAAPTPAAAPPPPPPAGPPSGSGRNIAGASALFAVTAFAASRLLVGGPSLAMLEQGTVPLDVALQNGKPTVVEFYADWCEVCRSLVADEYILQGQHKDDLNFVMLNVDNSKWAPEVSEYKVGGIPHFVFLDKENTPLAATVGKLPTEVLAGNVNALAKGEALPYAALRGQTSSREDAPPVKLDTQPRDHA